MLAVSLGYDVAGFAEAWGAGRDVVGVGGEDVDPAVAEEGVADLLGGAAHVAEEGAAGDLDEEAVAEPVLHAVEVALEGGVALGMGEDGREAGELELVEGLGEGGGEAVVGQLDEQVGGAVDGELFGVGDGFVDVVVAEMEVAADAEGEVDVFGGEGVAEGGEALGVALWVVGIGAAGVGGAHDVGDAVFKRDAGHGDRGFEVGRAVVEAEEQVVVDVNHSAEVKGIIAGW